MSGRGVPTSNCFSCCIVFGGEKGSAGADDIRTPRKGFSYGMLTEADALDGSAVKRQGHVVAQPLDGLHVAERLLLGLHRGAVRLIAAGTAARCGVFLIEVLARVGHRRVGAAQYDRSGPRAGNLVVQHILAVDFEGVPVVAAVGLRDGDGAFVEACVTGHRGDVEPAVLYHVVGVMVVAGLAVADSAGDVEPAGADMVRGLVAAVAGSGLERVQVAVTRDGVGTRRNLVLVARLDEQVEADDVTLVEFARVDVYARRVMLVGARRQTDVDILVAARRDGGRLAGGGDFIHGDVSHAGDINLRLRVAAGLLDVIHVEDEVLGERRRTVVVVVVGLVREEDVAREAALDGIAGLGLQVEGDFVLRAAELLDVNRSVVGIGVVARLGARVSRDAVGAEGENQAHDFQLGNRSPGPLFNLREVRGRGAGVVVLHQLALRFGVEELRAGEEHSDGHAALLVVVARLVVDDHLRKAAAAFEQVAVVDALGVEALQLDVGHQMGIRGHRQAVAHAQVARERNLVLDAVAVDEGGGDGGDGAFTLDDHVAREGHLLVASRIVGLEHEAVGGVIGVVAVADAVLEGSRGEGPPLVAAVEVAVQHQCVASAPERELRALVNREGGVAHGDVVVVGAGTALADVPAENRGVELDGGTLLALLGDADAGAFVVGVERLAVGRLDLGLHLHLGKRGQTQLQGARDDVAGRRCRYGYVFVDQLIACGREVDVSRRERGDDAQVVVGLPHGFERGDALRGREVEGIGGLHLVVDVECRAEGLHLVVVGKGVFGDDYRSSVPVFVVLFARREECAEGSREEEQQNQIEFFHL